MIPCRIKLNGKSQFMKKKYHLSFTLFILLTIVSNRGLAGVVCAGDTILQGIDVSVYQGTINWTDVKNAGIVFAYARVNDGSFLDTTFSSNWAGMKTAGIIRGAYSYFEPAQDPTTQANDFLNALGTLQPGDLPPMLDLEITGGESAGTIITNVNTWMRIVQAATGRIPIIYTAPGFWNASVGSTNFSLYPLWAVNWSVTCPTLAEGWTSWVIWQYSDSGTVSGISGSVDLDEFNGSMSDILIFGNKQSLNIAPENGRQLSITWSTFAVGFGLQQCSNLETTNWVNVTNTPVVLTSQEQVTLSTSTNATFFRLFHP